MMLKTEVDGSTPRVGLGLCTRLVTGDGVT